MPHRTFLAFIFPSILAMLLFITLPIISVGLQSLFVEHEAILTTVENCDPFGCTKATREPSFAQSMKLQGTRVSFLNANDYAQFLAKIDNENKAVMTDLGLIKK